MRLNYILQALALGELSGTSFSEGGTIAPEKIPQVVSSIQLGLTDLHKRFKIRRETVRIQAYPRHRAYKIHSGFSVSAKMTDPHVIDTEKKPFQDNLIEILKVSYRGKEIPLDEPGGIYTTTPQTMYIDGPILTDGLYEVEYQADHPVLDLSMCDFGPQNPVVDCSGSPDYLDNIGLPVSALINIDVGDIGWEGTTSDLDSLEINGVYFEYIGHDSDHIMEYFDLYNQNSTPKRIKIKANQPWIPEPGVPAPIIELYKVDQVSDRELHFCLGESRPAETARFAGGEGEVHYSAPDSCVVRDEIVAEDQCDPEIELPMAYLQALLYYVASRHITGSAAQISQDYRATNPGVHYRQLYEAECLRLSEQGIEAEKTDEQNLFKQRGFI